MKPPPGRYRGFAASSDRLDSADGPFAISGYRIVTLNGSFVWSLEGFPGTAGSERKASRPGRSLLRNERRGE